VRFGERPFEVFAEAMGKRGKPTGGFMGSKELFRSCANEHVAAAALACVGGTLHRRVTAAARRVGLSSGAYVSSLLADYDRKASPHRRRHLEQGMRCAPMPILAGLRHVVETALDGEWDVASEVVPSEAETTTLITWPVGRARRSRGASVKMLYS
jgi:hypothetical protein